MTAPARWSPPATNTALTDAEASADQLRAELREAQRGRRLAQDAYDELRRRHNGALHLINTFDPMGAGGYTAVLLIDLRLLLESSTDPNRSST